MFLLVSSEYIIKLNAVLMVEWFLRIWRKEHVSTSDVFYLNVADKTQKPSLLPLPQPHPPPPPPPQILVNIVPVRIPAIIRALQLPNDFCPYCLASPSPTLLTLKKIAHA